MNFYFLAQITILMVATLVLGGIKDMCVNYMCMYRLYDDKGRLNTDPISGLHCKSVHLCFFEYQQSDNSVRLPFGLAFNITSFQRFRVDLKLVPKMKLVASVQIPFLKFQSIASRYGSHRTFIKTLLDFARNNNFDGLSLKFLNLYDTIDVDRVSLASLLTNFRKWIATDATNRSLSRLTLSHILTAQQNMLKESASINFFHRFMDYTILAAMDMALSVDYPTHNAPLTGSTNNVVSSLRHWLSNNDTRRKLFLGIPLYGILYNLTDSQLNSDVGATIISARKVCYFRQNTNVTFSFDTKEQVPFMNHSQFWLGYENRLSLELKVSLMIQSKLAGVAVFYVNDDDVSGYFCKEGVFPFMRYVYMACLNMNYYATG
nr:contactin-2-like; partial [Biomphalaria glabrata]